MYYEGSNHGLKHDPFKAIVTPRPIGWISTVDKEGRPNLAPYSFFNAMGSRPNFIAFGSEQMKDSAHNARDTGEFVFSLCTTELADAMNLSCADLPAGQNEYEHAGLEAAACKLVKAPRVAISPASLECKTTMCQALIDIDGNETHNYLVVGQVVAVHINDDYIRDGRFDTARAVPLARCGYRDYSSVTELFELMRPGEGERGGQFKV
tara:strand:- start:50 stop:673 length:624 start_codon:yes stop_codon:yes gene_type:complete